jgi:hypothetical protein
MIYILMNATNECKEFFISKRLWLPFKKMIPLRAGKITYAAQDHRYCLARLPLHGFYL